MKALIADIDDTICKSTQPVSPAMAAELNRIAAAGIMLAFISGSTLEQLFGQLGPGLKQPFHILAASGTHYATVSYESGKAAWTEVYRQGFQPEEKAEIMAAFEALIASQKITPLTSREDQLQDRGSQITLSALGRHAPDHAKRAFDPEMRVREGWLKIMHASLGGKYNIRIGGTTSVDVTPKGIDKAWGITRFLEIRKLQPSEALYFGDKLGPEGNDYPARRVLDAFQVENELDTLRLLKNFLPRL
jgi:phosphomannomutase